MKKKLPRSAVMLTLLLCAALGLTWLAGMYCLTSVTAQYAAARYEKANKDRADALMYPDGQYYWEWDRDYANYKLNCLWEIVSHDAFGSSSLITGSDDAFLERRNGYEEFVATAVYDAEGELLECSWKDFISFEYLTEEQWLAGEERSHNNARAYFDREKLTELGQKFLADGSINTLEVQALRFTGSFDGVEFTPTKIECITWNDFYAALSAKGSGTYTVSGVVEVYDLTWYSIYENTAVLPAGAETVTLYSDWSVTCCHEVSPSFSYNGKNYTDLSALVSEVGPGLAEGYQNLTRYEGLDLLVLSVSYCSTYKGENDYSPYWHGPKAYAEEGPTLNFYVVSAVYCSPWRTAMRELRDVYIITFLLAAGLVLWVRAVLKRQLLRPIELVGQAMSEEREGMGKYTGEDWTWREGCMLEEGFERLSDRLRLRQNEIARLNTALDYAKNAEEHRRQMTSNITHELKTPLAIVHSYAEGLKEQIAEDKRERYLDVILSETERMDGMVLEMLELSRLEAGRVKLSRDTVSLPLLTRSIFDKLERAIQAKALQVKFALPDELTITADEARIAQVIENFASNAVKYTPSGGQIRVTLSARRGKATFALENDCESLSEEALGRVWDTFYRVDEARSGGGTGLGLAIAKSIVELHGGTCAVENTEHGVRFSFTV